MIHHLHLEPAANHGMRVLFDHDGLADMANGAIHECGTPIIVEGVRMYRLKSEYEDEVSPF
jgi:hypothetical protein